MIVPTTFPYPEPGKVSDISSRTNRTNLEASHDDSSGSPVILYDI